MFQTSTGSKTNNKKEILLVRDHHTDTFVLQYRPVFVVVAALFPKQEHNCACRNKSVAERSGSCTVRIDPQEVMKTHHRHLWKQNCKWLFDVTPFFGLWMIQHNWLDFESQWDLVSCSGKRLASGKWLRTTDTVLVRCFIAAAAAAASTICVS